MTVNGLKPSDGAWESAHVVRTMAVRTRRRKTRSCVASPLMLMAIMPRTASVAPSAHSGTMI